MYCAQLFAKLAERQFSTREAEQQHGMVRRDQVNGGIKYLPLSGEWGECIR